MRLKRGLGVKVSGFQRKNRDNMPNYFKADS